MELYVKTYLYVLSTVSRIGNVELLNDMIKDKQILELLRNHENPFIWIL
jgi:hypothetical protein